MSLTFIVPGYQEWDPKLLCSCFST